jgi:hypothetical protein
MEDVRLREPQKRPEMDERSQAWITLTSKKDRGSCSRCKKDHGNQQPCLSKGEEKQETLTFHNEIRRTTSVSATPRPSNSGRYIAPTAAHARRR